MRTASPGLCATPMSPGPMTTHGAMACRIEASVPNGAVVACLSGDRDAVLDERVAVRQVGGRAFLGLAHCHAMPGGGFVDRRADGSRGRCWRSSET